MSNETSGNMRHAEAVVSEFRRIHVAWFTGSVVLLFLLVQIAAVPASAYLCPSQTERAVVALLNQQRLNNGVLPLRIEVRLTEAARLHSRDMALRDYFSHYTNPEVCSPNPNDPACIDPGVRIDRTGYSWWTYGENIAAGRSTPQATVNDWMNSSGHRANILSSSFRDIGAGYYSGAGTYNYYWNTDFATGGNPIQTPSECVNVRLGVFRNGSWYVDGSGDMIWQAPPVDRAFAFGISGDRPVMGDWQGAGNAGPGVFRNGMWALDWNGSGIWEGGNDRLYAFGLATDMPVVGDWNGDGRTEIGVFRAGTWILDYNGNGVWNGPVTDRVLVFGASADIPVTGDWNGDGITEIGVYRRGTWYLDYNGNGVWNGPVTDRVLVFGASADIPVTGDWNGDGITEIGVFSNGTWVLDMNGNGVWDGPSIDKTTTFGFPADRPAPGVHR